MSHSRTVFWAICVVIVVAYIAMRVSTYRDESALSDYQFEPSAPVEPQLELEASSWHSGYGYATFEGAVKNLTAESLDDIEAVASFYDKDGGFITSDTALIDYQPILAGQTSAFKVMTTWNPKMASAKVEFKRFWGGTISCRQAPPKPKSNPQKHRRRHK